MGSGLQYFTSIVLEQVIDQSLNMALPLPSGLTPRETAFLCEMELVTIIPRQRLEGLQLLGVSRLHLTMPTLYYDM